MRAEHYWGSRLKGKAQEEKRGVSQEMPLLSSVEACPELVEGRPQTVPGIIASAGNIAFILVYICKKSGLHLPGGGHADIGCVRAVGTRFDGRGEMLSQRRMMLADLAQGDFDGASNIHPCPFRR